MEKDLITIITEILAAIQIGSIIIRIIDFFEHKSNNSEELHNKIFNLYKHLYYSGVSDSFNNDLPTSEAIIFFDEFINTINYNNEIAILLSDEIIKLLNIYKDSMSEKDKENHLNTLQKRARKEYKKLKKKQGYLCKSKLGSFIYIMNIILCICFIVMFIAAGLYTIFACPADNKNIYIALCFCLLGYIYIDIDYLRNNKHLL